MKAIFFALVSFAVSALATPIIAERQLEAQADEIDQLTQLVMVHTANINKTNAAVQDNPSVDQQNAAAAAMAPDFEAITAALTAASTTIAKREWAAHVAGRTGGGACPHDCLLVKIQLLVWEIACTLKVVIVKLGLTCVLVYLKPLILALIALITSLDKVVVGVLILVKSLLKLVLGTVAALLLELIL